MRRSLASDSFGRLSALRRRRRRRRLSRAQMRCDTFCGTWSQLIISPKSRRRERTGSNAIFRAIFRPGRRAGPERQNLVHHWERYWGFLRLCQQKCEGLKRDQISATSQHLRVSCRDDGCGPDGRDGLQSSQHAGVSLGKTLNPNNARKALFKYSPFNLNCTHKCVEEDATKWRTLLCLPPTKKIPPTFNPTVILIKTRSRWGELFFGYVAPPCWCRLKHSPIHAITCLMYIATDLTRVFMPEQW